MSVVLWSRWGRLAATALLVEIAVALPGLRAAGGQAVAGGPTLEDLQRAIGERDAAISGLTRRVEELERRLAATAAEQPPAGVEPTGTVLLPTAADPLAEPEEPLVGTEQRTSTPSAAPSASGGLQPPALRGTATAQAELDPEEPAPAPGEFVVDEEAIERALERALVQTGALLLPAGTIEVDPNFTYVRREDEAPGLIQEDGEITATANELRRNELEAGLTLRVGLPYDLQLETDVPFSYKDISNITEVQFAARGEERRDGAGLGDVSVSLAKGLLRERGWRPDLIARVGWDSDTGGTAEGVPLGSGFHEIRGSLTAVKRQDPLVFVGGLSYTHAFEDDGIQPGDEFGFSLGTVLAASPETSLRFLLAQVFTDELEVDGGEIDGTDQVSTSLILGASSIIGPRAVVDVTVGIGLTEDAPDYSITLSLPIRFDLPFRF